MNDYGQGGIADTLTVEMRGNVFAWHYMLKFRI